MTELVVILSVFTAAGFAGWALAEKADLQRRLATATKPKVACHE